MGVFRQRSSYAVWIVSALAGCHRQPKPVPIVHQAPLAREEPRRVAYTQDPISSTRVSPGELTGIVLDAESGQPLAYAQVAIIIPAGTVYTDSSGRFRLAPLPRGAQVIHAGRIGYGRVRMPIDANPDSGYVTVIALPRNEVVLCRVFTSVYVPQSGVAVAVRDALTGIGVSVPITITATDGAYRDSVVVEADSLGRTHRTIAPDRPGVYHVTVKAPGYRDWSASAETRPIPGCVSDFYPAAFHAWLVPM